MRQPTVLRHRVRAEPVVNERIQRTHAPDWPAREDDPADAVPARERRKRRATKAHADSLLGKLAETLGVLFVLVIAAGLWWVGGYLTLLALTSVGIPVTHLHVALQWLIPACISVIELWWWPRVGLKPVKVVVFALFVVVDIASTLYGAHTWLKGRFIQLGTGFTIPKSGAWLIVPAVGASIVLTFVPERLARWCFHELGDIWAQES